MKVLTSFWYHSMCFWISHVISEFQVFIRIFTTIKLKNKNANWKKNGEKGRVLWLFQSSLSQLINKLQAPYLCQIKAHYIVYRMFKNIAIIKTFSVSNHKKSRVRFSTFKTLVNLNIESLENGSSYRYETCFIKFFILFSLTTLWNTRKNMNIPTSFSVLKQSDFADFAYCTHSTSFF